MVPRLSIRFDKKNTLVVKKSIRSFHEKVGRSTLSILKKAAEGIRADMSVEGGEVVRPIRWDSEKQRKAFFATDGFGGGIPHHRRGITNNSWRVIRYIDDARDGFLIGNPLKHARYLYGTATKYDRVISRIHRGTYPIFVKVRKQHVANLPRKIRDQVTVIARREGFKTK